MSMLLVLAATMLAVAAYFAGEVVTQPSQERRRAVRRAADYGRIRGAITGLEKLRFQERVLTPAAASLARIVLRLSPRLTMEAIAARLLEAGLGRTVTPTTFLAAKGAGALTGGFFGLIAGGSAGGATMAFLFAMLFAVGGFTAPGFVVGMRTRKRRDAIRAQLPDALLTISGAQPWGDNGQAGCLGAAYGPCTPEERELKRHAVSARGSCRRKAIDLPCARSPQNRNASAATPKPRS